MKVLAQAWDRADLSQRMMAVFAAVALPILVVVAIFQTVNHQSPDQQYEHLYTDTGKCLHGTPYDPSQGAHTTVLQDKGYPYPILAVIPKDANFEKPSVLFFAVVTRQGDSSPSLLGADHLVLSYMYEKCRVDLR